MNTLKLFKKDFYERIGGLKQFSGKRVLDLGCGDGEDSYAIASYAKSVIGIDIKTNSNWKKIKRKNLSFKVSKAEKLSFKNRQFDGLFLKDVLHHVEDIDKTLGEIKRVTSKSALIILIEGNRYNPLFFIHMTKLRGHDHLTQKEFKRYILKYFNNVQFIHFEAHYLPFIGEDLFRKVIKLEKTLERYPFLKPFLSYNVAKINR